jgi:16S rRNA (adenine1518-N6/adenine1519-N6)-dimethyltransferase
VVHFACAAPAVTLRGVAQSKHQIQSVLAQAGSHPRHRFGQNFMIDQNLVRLIADAGLIGPGDVVIEVGPGTGTLTEELLARASRVVVVEIDRDLARVLRERYADRESFRLIEGDALAGKHALNEEVLAELSAAKASGNVVRLVANLPYNIASPLVIEMLIAGVESLTFTVQLEVADRLRAGGGDDAYGPLSVTANLLADVEILRTLPPQAFWPAPKIDSALVRMIRRDRLGEKAGAFGRFVQRIFSARRKTMRKALAQMDLPADALLEKLSIDPKIRPEELSPAQLLALFDAAAG